MGIKHFQQFDIAGETADEIAFPSAFQLRRAQSTQRREHTVTDQRQQLESDIMIARLFTIAKHAPADAEHRQHSEEERPGKRIRRPQCLQYAQSAEHRDHDRAEKAQRPQTDRTYHPQPQRTDQSQHRIQDANPASLHVPAPFHNSPVPAVHSTAVQNRHRHSPAVQSCLVRRSHRLPSHRSDRRGRHWPDDG